MNLTRPIVFKLILALAALSGGAALAAYPMLERFYMRQQAVQNDVPLKLASEGLAAALDRYAPLPALIAERPELAQLLRTPDNAQLRARVNEALRQTALTTRAVDIMLMDVTGRTRAAASYQAPRNSLGQNFSYQTFFAQALDGLVSSFSFYGTTTGENGYFYAAPVEDENRIVGVIALKFDIAAFESVWRGADSDVIVADQNAFVLMSSRPDWHFRALRPLSDETMSLIARNLEYPIDRIDLLPISATQIAPDAQLVQIGRGPGEAFVRTSQRVGQRTLTISFLSPTGPVRVTALATLVMVGLTVMLLLGALMAYLLKQVRQADALAAEREAKHALEAAVAARTADLSTALADLRHTQTALIQAEKLSALGQMSAALSHELNQPLAVVKSYAVNAGKFLDRNKPDEARDNIQRISRMVDRMASISRHLRNFARSPKQATGPLMLNAVLHDAIVVMEVRLKAENAHVAYTPPADDIWVLGGHVRLQQVFVNLINNALDAMQDQRQKSVRIDVAGTVVTVADTGPGLSEELADKIFDPFFTTKTPGNGLGLGLSISYNIVTGFGGTLAAVNGPGGGLEMRVSLRPAPPVEAAAQ